jgi:hypothetical protein
MRDQNAKALDNPTQDPRFPSDRNVPHLFDRCKMLLNCPSDFDCFAP